jgi:hypothetical protein
MAPTGTPKAERGADLSYNLALTLEQAYSGKVIGIDFNNRHFEVSVPAGIEDGSRIRLAGEGDPGSPPGDFYISISIPQHAFFIRDGSDLHCRVPISMQTAMYGGTVDIPVIDRGVVSIKIPEATQSGRRFRLRTKGMPVLRSKEVGDMYVEVVVETPDPRTRRCPESEGYNEKLLHVKRELGTTLERSAVQSVGTDSEQRKRTSIDKPMLVISYRRLDTRWIAGRILDRLEAYFGNDSVFIDIEDMPPGVDFREHIDLMLQRCDVLLALIGPQWTGPVGASQPQIFDETDWVRIEIEAALRKNIPVIPILIDRSPMPLPQHLPPSLREFAFRHGVEVDPGKDFNVHIERLLRGIDKLFGREGPTGAEKSMGSMKAEKSDKK